MKKLLVLGAGILQLDVIIKAKELGYYVIAADGSKNAIGFDVADIGIVVDITSEDDMLYIAKCMAIDGVIHPCSEVAMNVMGRINDELGLSGVTKEQAIRATNKHLMREAFKQNGAPSPKSYLTASVQDAWNLLKDKIKGDGIIKPSRNSGSRGISKVTDRTSFEEFEYVYNRALRESRDNSVLIEEFVSGPEFSVEIIVWDSHIYVLQVTDKKTTEDPYFVELGHNQPSIYPKEVVDTITEAAISGVKALSVNNCACHAELKYQNGKAYIMEIGARLGGDFISTELTHLSTGVDMVAAAINCSLGIEPNLEQSENGNAACIRYFCPSPGKFIGIKNIDILNDSRVYSWKIYPQKGDIIQEVTSSGCRSGHVIVVDKNINDAISFAERITSNVEFEIE